MPSKFPTQLGILCDPADDGKTYINVYTKGKTDLGKLLTNPSPIPVTLYRFGWFACMEALWYWLTMGCRHRDLRMASGLKAKIIAKQRKLEPTYIPGFELIIRYASTIKVMRNWRLRKMFFASTLPLLHYYSYGEYPDCVVRPANGSLWTVKHLTDMRALGRRGTLKWLVDNRAEFEEAVDRVCEMIRPAAKSA